METIVIIISGAKVILRNSLDFSITQLFENRDSGIITLAFKPEISIFSKSSSVARS